jgi:hypothetical protein
MAKRKLNSKYPEGYKAKIEYYAEKIREAANTNNWGDLYFYNQKLQYFVERHEQMGF